MTLKTDGCGYYPPRVSGDSPGKYERNGLSTAESDHITMEFHLRRRFPRRDGLSNLYPLFQLPSASRTTGMRVASRLVVDHQDLRTTVLTRTAAWDLAMTGPCKKHNYNLSRVALCSCSPTDDPGRNPLALLPSVHPQPWTGPPLEVIEVGRW